MTGILIISEGFDVKNKIVPCTRDSSPCHVEQYFYYSEASLLDSINTCGLVGTVCTNWDSLMNLSSTIVIVDYLILYYLLKRLSHQFEMLALIS